MRRLGTLAGLSLLIVAACTDGAIVSRAPTGTANPTTEAANGTGTWAHQVTGKTGPGSRYALLVPTDWNGDAVFYAHGLREPAEPVDLDLGTEVQSLVDGLGAMGYAVAYSSFSSNGLNVADGIQRTHQLRGLFASRFGTPVRSYLVGRSMGAVIAEALAEKHPSQYDGALLMCGELGGFGFEISYMANIRLLFDYFYPGVLPGQLGHMPPNVDLVNDIIIPAQTAIVSDPTGLSAMLQIDDLYIPGSNLTEKITSILNVVGFHALAANDVVQRARGRLPFDNADYVYTSQTLPSTVMDAVNAGIARYSITPDAVAFLQRSYEPTGAISFPELTLHGEQDYIAPFVHESMFLQRVTGAGATNLLVQRSITGTFGHCKFDSDPAVNLQTMLSAFDDLVNWVMNGTKPTP